MATVIVGCVIDRRVSDKDGLLNLGDDLLLYGLPITLNTGITIELFADSIG
jgi:hypothetical protein